MSLTLRQAIDRSLRRMALASGADVQTYSEEHLKDIIQQVFNTLFDSNEIWWPQFYTAGEQMTLGANGLVVTDLTNKIKRFEDIRYIWLNQDTEPLPRGSIRDVASTLNTAAWSYVPSATGIFQIMPTTASGYVTVAYRTRPDDLENETDVINMDADLIVYGAAYDYLNSLGTNPSLENKMLVRFNDRFETLKFNIAHKEVSLYSPSNYDTSAWQERY
jgi:hypothetical protein